MTKKEKQFIETVWDYYKRHGRRSLPWRLTRNPYRILVSEIMLQQTQVERVIPKYQNFLRCFPTLESLSEASLGEVLREWQGLGYNRRAKMLHECTKQIVSDHGGRFPRTYAVLITLRGVGHYTAGAIMAFAWNKPTPIIETNIRTIFIHHFFNDATDVDDKEILEIVERTLDRENSREWYYALMDYGVYIKKEFGNPNSRSKHYIKQSAFKNSDRQIRGAILRLLSSDSCTRIKILKKLLFNDIRVDAQLEKLIKEGMIEIKNQKYRLPNI